jgi:hypothetical protein
MGKRRPGQLILQDPSSFSDIHFRLTRKKRTNETGKPVPDTPSMRSSGEFGAQLLLTSSEQAFRQNWNTTAGTPKLHTTRTVKVGQSISGVILFTGCTPGGNHACVVSAAFSLASPDGSKSPAGNGQVWSKAPPKPRVIMLGDASITIGFGPDDAQPSPHSPTGRP